MLKVAVLGKGQLAIRACEVISRQADMALEVIMPVRDEPEWDSKLSAEAEARWPGAELLRSGDWRDLLGRNYDIVVSVLYDQIIGSSLISECSRIINCHLGPLPKYRGVRPANWALKNGELVHGVTIHDLVPEIDAGPIIAQVKFPIWPHLDEVRDVWQRSRRYAGVLLEEVLPLVRDLPSCPQDNSMATTYYYRDDWKLGERRYWTRQTLSGT